MGITQKNIALCIVFSIITCGLYGIYWLACLADDTNQVSNRTNETSGGMVVLFTIITCGLYHLFWCYKAGEKIDEARQMRGLPPKSSGLLYLILAIFNLSIITWALLQNELNEMSAINGAPDVRTW